MAENVKYNGTVVTIGSCESLHYVTYKGLKNNLSRLSYTGGNLLPEQYLNPEHHFYYRFPFADESQEKFLHDDCERSVRYVIPREWLRKDVQLCHKQIWLYNDKVSGIRFGVDVDCPADPHCGQRLDGDERVRQYLFFDLMYQTIRENRLMIVIRCPFCGKLCIPDTEEIQEIAHAVFNIHDAFDETKKENIRRALAGYKTIITE